MRYLKQSKNILFGGDDSNNNNNNNNNNILTQSSNKQIEMFLAIIIIGYFGVKVVYGLFFGFYPNKYYYRNVDITTNDETNSTTKNIALNAYVPGIWNNETSDFITLLVLIFVVYIFTNVSEKSVINKYGNLNFTFLFGYILGLGYPPIYNNYANLFNKQFQDSIMIRYIYLIILIGLATFIIIMNYASMTTLSSSHKINYIIYNLN